MLNIGSYMGGVDLWQNDFEHDDNFSLQSMHDKVLEVVCVRGAWHLGKLRVCEIFIIYIYLTGHVCYLNLHAPILCYGLVCNPFIIFITFAGWVCNPFIIFITFAGRSSLVKMGMFIFM